MLIICRYNLRFINNLTEKLIMVKPVTPSVLRSQVKKIVRAIQYHPQVSFNEYHPISKPSLIKETAVIIGDLHACVPSLVQRLIEENIVQLSNNNYDKLTEINSSTYIEQMDQVYKDWKYFESRSQGITFSLTQKKFYSFSARQKKSLYEEIKAIVEKERVELRQICEQIKVIDTDKLVKLLGDELCDRNVCDYDMLYLIFTLIKKGVKLQSTLSNHALEFLIAALKKNWALDSPMFMLQGSYRSFTALKLLLVHGIITQVELQPLIKVWQDSVRVVFCSIHDAGVTTYSHAPVGKETYQAFAQLFNIPFKDETPELLNETLMRINASFKLSLLTSPTHPNYFIKVIDKEYEKYMHGEGKGYPHDAPYLRSTWNRNLADIVRPTFQGQGYVWDHVCGHEMFETVNSPQTKSLDNLWGKPVNASVNYLFTEILPRVPGENTEIHSLCYSSLGDNFIGYSGSSCIGQRMASEDFVPLPMRIFKGVVMVPPNASHEIIKKLIYADTRSRPFSVSLQMNAMNSADKPEINYMTTNEVFPGSPGLLQNIGQKKRSLLGGAANDSHINVAQTNKKTKLSKGIPTTLFFGQGKENQSNNKELITTASNSSISDTIMCSI